MQESEDLSNIKHHMLLVKILCSEGLVIRIHCVRLKDKITRCCNCRIELLD